MSRAEILEWERRWALRAALCAFAAAGLFVAATVVRGDTLVGASSTAEALRDFQANRGDLLLAAILRALALGAFALPLYYLFRAANARSAGMRGGFVGIVIAGPLFLAVLDVIFWLAVSPAAEDFATPGGGAGIPIGTYAENLVKDQPLLSVYQGLGLAGRIGFTFAVIYTALWAMRSGLLTRFMGTLGMALGAAQILIDFSVLALMFWMAWVGVIILDRLPGGRPRAWETGAAIPWPKAGEPPLEDRAEAEAIDGDATALATDGPNPNAARRERAKRRKRKRRSA